jgi:putative CocE/NonD family hydrolase
LSWGELQYRWFDHWLKDIDNGVERERAVRIFVMNRGWRVDDEWPLARARYTPFFLHGGGRANTLNGDGVLSLDPPSAEPPDTFSYDPMDPVPTVGAQGIHDHRRVETRADVLIYSTPPLEEQVEVTGPVKLILYGASSAPDTDFTANLIDVAPNGYAANLCDGILRARYRDAARRSGLMEPGRPYQFTIDLIATSNLFQRGHRIRLEVSSSNFPRFDRNLNTGAPVAESSEPRIALQTIFHNSEHASRLLLPIISDR